MACFRCMDQFIAQANRAFYSFITVFWHKTETILYSPVLFASHVDIFVKLVALHVFSRIYTETFWCLI